MMQGKDMAALRGLADRVRTRYPEARVYAFGSRVRGEAEAESDLDVCVVLDRLDGASRRFVSDQAWETGFDADVFISTVVFSSERFDKRPGAANPLVSAILAEGVAP